MNLLIVLFFAHSSHASKHDTRKRSELLTDDADIVASGDEIVDMRDVAERVDELSYVNMVLVKQMDEVVSMLKKNGKSGTASEDESSGLKSTIKQLKKEKMILKRQNNQLNKRLESCGKDYDYADIDSVSSSEYDSYDAHVTSGENINICSFLIFTIILACTAL